MISETPRRSATVHAELTDLQKVLTGMPSDFLETGAFDAYQNRVKLLQEELYYAELLENNSQIVPILDVRLEKPALAVHALPASFVGSFLNLWQQMFSALGQAAKGQPTRRGLIKKEILDQTTLMVQPFATGSFAIRMNLPARQQTLFQDEQDQPLGVSAFEEFARLAEAGSSEEQLRRVCLRLEGRVASMYARLLEHISKEQVEMTVALKRPGSGQLRITRISAKEIGRIRHTLSKVSEEQDSTVELRAELKGANLRTGSFELDLGEEGILQGKAEGFNLNFLAGKPLGSTWVFTLAEKIETHDSTGEQTFSYLLLGISPG